MFKNPPESICQGQFKINSILRPMKKLERDLLFESPFTRIIKPKVNSANKELVVKVLNVKSPGSDVLGNFLMEFEITQNLDLPGVRRSYQVTTEDGAYALLLEYIPGVSLQDLIRKGRCGLDLFLKIAVGIADALANLHEAGIIHNDIAPGNILFNQPSGKVTLIDFANAAQMLSGRETMAPPLSAYHDLNYISPELTGRTHQNLDHRSDIYALGAVYYALLSGKAPFQRETPMELMHAHLTQIPTPVSTLNPQIPEVISWMLEKMMAKNPAERYQSVRGLLADLEKCQHRFRNTGGIQSFELGTEDYSPQFSIVGGLWGRMPEKKNWKRQLPRYTRAVRVFS